MAQEKSKTSELESLNKELMKQHSVLDGQGRVIAIYQAVISAGQGDHCLLTRFKYKDPTSTVIINSVESNAIWDPSGDGNWEDVEVLP